jgi:hypothetical protein
MTAKSISSTTSSWQVTMKVPVTQVKFFEENRSFLFICLKPWLLVKGIDLFVHSMQKAKEQEPFLIILD